MGGGVDEPGEVEGHCVSGDRGHVPRDPGVLAPEVDGDPGGDYEAEDWHHHEICSGKRL